MHSNISDSSRFLSLDVLKGFHAKRLSRDTFNLHLVSTWITCPLEQFIFLSTVKLSIPIATTVNTTNANQRFVSFLQGQTEGTRLCDDCYIFLFSCSFILWACITLHVWPDSFPHTFFSSAPKTKLVSQTVIINAVRQVGNIRICVAVTPASIYICLCDVSAAAWVRRCNKWHSWGGFLCGGGE